MYEQMIKNGLILSFEQWYQELYAIITLKVSYITPANAQQYYQEYVNEIMSSYNLPPHF